MAMNLTTSQGDEDLDAIDRQYLRWRDGELTNRQFGIWLSGQLGELLDSKADESKLKGYVREVYGKDKEAVPGFEVTESARWTETYVDVKALLAAKDSIEGMGPDGERIWAYLEQNVIKTRERSRSGQVNFLASQKNQQREAKRQAAIKRYQEKHDDTA